MSINFRKLKHDLNSEQIIKIVNSLGGEVYKQNNTEIIFYSCCHHLKPMEHKPKLYYYIDTQSFFCYSCSSSFDIISLVQERWNLENKEFMFMNIITYIADIANIQLDNIQRYTPVAKNNTPWQEILNKYDRLKNIPNNLKLWDKRILNFFDTQYPLQWVNEGISIEAMKQHHIKYYSLKNQTVIPCYDENNNLIGIRVRNWNPNKSCKYNSLKTIALFDKPFDYIHMNQNKIEIYGTDFKFNTNKVLYGLNLNQYAIEKKKQVIIAESEKAVLKSFTWYGHNSITVGMFGNNLNIERRNMLLQRGIDEVIIVPDYDYISVDDVTYTQWWNKQIKLAKKFQGFCNVTIVMNDKNYVPHKDNAFDVDQSKFEYLVEHRKSVFDK